MGDKKVVCVILMGAVLQALINTKMIDTQSGSITISDSNMQIVGGLFANNSNSAVGAVLVDKDSSVLIDSTVFQGNAATSGGALNVSASFSKVCIASHCFHHSVAVSMLVAMKSKIACTLIYDHMGIWLIDTLLTVQLLNATVAITNSSFTGNTNGNSQGGGVTSIYSRLSVLGSAFLGNTGTRGGAVYVEGGELNLNSSTFVKNRANSTGGGLYQTASKLRIFNSTFSSNLAGSASLGVYSSNTCTHQLGKLHYTAWAARQQPENMGF